MAGRVTVPSWGATPDDPLAAGLEAIDSKLETSTQLPSRGPPTPRETQSPGTSHCLRSQSPGTSDSEVIVRYNGAMVSCIQQIQQ